MKRNFELEQCGKERGDCTAPFDVVFLKPLTVEDFICDVLSDNREWGYIGIEKPGEIFGDPKCKYRYGKLLTCLPPRYLSKKIVSARADGGYGSMDYLLTIEDDITDSQINHTEED